MLVGYLRVIPLSTTEIELLTIASLARVVVRALVTNWRIAEVPERAEYLRMHARKDWERIENAINFGIDAAAEYLLTAQISRNPTELSTDPDTEVGEHGLSAQKTYPAASIPTILTCSIPHCAQRLSAA